MLNFLAQELAALGIPHYYQSVVGDKPDPHQAGRCHRLRTVAADFIYGGFRSNPR